MRAFVGFYVFHSSVRWVACGLNNHLFPLAHTKETLCACYELSDRSTLGHAIMYYEKSTEKPTRDNAKQTNLQEEETTKKFPIFISIIIFPFPVGTHPRL